MLKIKADQKLATEKPSTNSLHNKMMIALITNKNKPNVNTVTGNVKSTKSGFTNKLSNPKTMATTIAVIKRSTLTPSKKLDNNVTNIAVTKSLIIIFINNLFKVFEKKPKLTKKLLILDICLI